MARNEEFERAEHIPIGSQSGAECGVAASGTDKKLPSTQMDKGPVFMLIPSDSYSSLQSDSMGVTGLNHTQVANS